MLDISMLFGIFGRRVGFVLLRRFDNVVGVLLISIGLLVEGLGLGRRCLILA